MQPACRSAHRPLACQTWGGRASRWIGIKMVRSGQIDQGMPGFSGSLDSSQVWNVVFYTLFPQHYPAELQTGRRSTSKTGQTCHGLTGSGSGDKAKPVV